MFDFFEAAWKVLLDLAPWLLLGAAVAGGLHVLLPKDFLERQFSGRWGVLKAVALGVPLPLCSCGVIPVGLSLKKGGGSDGATVAFLISTPQTGIDSIFVSASLLGWPFALFKVFSAAATGVIGGLLVDAGGPAGAANETLHVQQPVPKQNRLRAFADHSLEMLQSIWRWLVVGIAISAAIEVFVPASAFTALQGYGGLAAMLVTLVISLPLYVCATASVPIAAALVASGLPTGAALVFLMAGPATNVATLGAVYRTLGKRPLAIYLATVVFGSIACGWAFEAVIDTNLTTGSHVHDSTNWWSLASAAVLLALFGKFAWHDLAARLPSKTSRRSKNQTADIQLAVRGMTCANCVAKLESTLRSDTNIDSAIVSLDDERLEVYGNVSETRVRQLVEQAGFMPE
ncbi:MAG: hypothetical protein GXP28_06770 [Planctomycetes bacterium]|nr:hypothetical protein [Planctomycetota bacterium]